MNGKTSTQTDKASPESASQLVFTEVQLNALNRSLSALELRLLEQQRALASEKELKSLGFSCDLAFWESAIADTELASKTVADMFYRASVAKEA